MTTGGEQHSYLAGGGGRCRLSVVVVGLFSVFSDARRRSWDLIVGGWCRSWAFVLILGGDGQSLLVVAGVGTVFACRPWVWPLLRWWGSFDIVW